MRQMRRWMSTNSAKWAALVEVPSPRKKTSAKRYDDEDPGKHIVSLEHGTNKVRGIGIVDAHELFANLPFGEAVDVPNTQKAVVRLPVRLPELCGGMLRGAQTISAKDAGLIIARLGIGRSDRVLEAGLGSGGLALHISRCLGKDGLHITVEPRDEHAAIGLANLERGADSWVDGPAHHHVHGSLEESVDQVATHAAEYDAIVLDLPNHEAAVAAAAPLLTVGGRLACYCPVTSQVEAAWTACESAGLSVEWAGELMERRWGRASKGGIRPINGSLGHTAFLLIAQRRAVV